MEQKNNPLHGKTLEMILQHLVDLYGWKDLGIIIKINCFNYDPSIKSREPLITLFLKINLAINLFGQDISSKKN
jgi:uncharacterized protein (DUF2132 family)